MPGLPPKAWKRLFLDVSGYSLFVGADEAGSMVIALAFDGADLPDPQGGLLATRG